MLLWSHGFGLFETKQDFIRFKTPCKDFIIIYCCTE